MNNEIMLNENKSISKMPHKKGEKKKYVRNDRKSY